MPEAYPLARRHLETDHNFLRLGLEQIRTIGHAISTDWDNNDLWNYLLTLLGGLSVDIAFCLANSSAPRLYSPINCRQISSTDLCCSIAMSAMFFTIPRPDITPALPVDSASSPSDEPIRSSYVLADIRRNSKAPSAEMPRSLQNSSTPSMFRVSLCLTCISSGTCRWAIADVTLMQLNATASMTCFIGNSPCGGLKD